MRKIAKRDGVGVSVVQRVKRVMLAGQDNNGKDISDDARKKQAG